MQLKIELPEAAMSVLEARAAFFGSSLERIASEIVLTGLGQSKSTDPTAMTSDSDKGVDAIRARLTAIAAKCGLT